MDIKVYVSVILHRHDGQILLVQEQKKANYGKWNLPGGHLEAGEKITAGAIREVKEETGLDVNLSGLLGLYSWRTGKEHALRYVFIAETKGDPKPGDEILEVKWVDPSEVAKMSDDVCLGRHCLRQIVRQFAQGLVYSLETVVEQDE